MNRLFVYGTLMQNHGNSRLFPTGTVHRRAITAPGFTLYGSGIPYLVRDPESRTRVRGEVVEVDSEAVLARIDSLEGHPNWYVRTPIKVQIEGQEGFTMAEAYLIPKEKGKFGPHAAVIEPNEEGIAGWPSQRVA